MNMAFRKSKNFSLETLWKFSLHSFEDHEFAVDVIEMGLDYKVQGHPIVHDELA